MNRNALYAVGAVCVTGIVVALILTGNAVILIFLAFFLLLAGL